MQNKDFNIEQLTNVVDSAEKLIKEMNDSIKTASKHFVGNSATSEEKKAFLEITRMSQMLSSGTSADLEGVMKTIKDIENKLNTEKK